MAFRARGRIRKHRKSSIVMLVVLALLIGMPQGNWAPTTAAQDLIALPPTAPGLAAPVDGATIDYAVDGVTLQWAAVPDALDYQDVLNDGERVGPWVFGTSWSPGTLPEGVYHWAVRARNSIGVGELGPLSTFTVAPLAAEASVPKDAPTEMAPLPFQLAQPVATAGDDAVLSGAVAPGAKAKDVSGLVTPRTLFQVEIPSPRLPVALHQQDATDATAGSPGQNGTVNGVPRESTDTAPAGNTSEGPGQVLLPPPVPGLPSGNYGVTSPNIDPALAAGIGGTTELTFDAVSDTTVFTSSPGSPQSSDSLGLLALGGDLGAVALMSFEVSGVGDGTVLGARLTFYGAGDHGAPGGGVGVIYDFIAPDGLTANGTPGAATTLNVQGAPAWFERVEPDGMSAVDVTGSVEGDGTITFVLSGQPEEMGSIYALESGVPAQLILTVALPA